MFTLTSGELSGYRGQISDTSLVADSRWKCPYLSQRMIPAGYCIAKASRNVHYFNDRFIYKIGGVESRSVG